MKYVVEKQSENEKKINTELTEIKKNTNSIDWIKKEIDSNNKSQYKLVLEPMKLSAYLKSKSFFLFVKSDSTQKPLTYCYENGVYRLYGDDEIRALIKSFIPQELINSKDVNEILFDLKTQNFFVDYDDLDSDEDLINFQDGFYKLSTNQFIPHSPDTLSTIQIPANFADLVVGSEDTCPVFMNYLHHLCNNDSEKESLLLEFLGLAISNVPGYYTKKALFLEGDGNSGKSQIKALAELLVGKKNVASIDLKNLTERFGTSAIYQKRLAGCNDMQYETIRDMSLFKQLTGGDSVSIEFKNNTQFSYRYKGVLWFVCNKMPGFYGDQGEWVYDRIVTVRCNNVIPEDKRDAKILEKMYAEKNAILNLAISHLKVLIKNNYKLTEPAEIKEIRQEYKINNNTLHLFIKEYCEIKNEEFPTKLRTKRSDFKKAYTVYVNRFYGGKGMLSMSEIKSTLVREYGCEIKKTNGEFTLSNILLIPQTVNELIYFEGNTEY